MATEQSAFGSGQLLWQDFDLEDWIIFCYHFAKHLNYFDLQRTDQVSDDWQVFFSAFGFVSTDVYQRGTVAYQQQKDKVTQVLNSHRDAGTLSAHLTLLVAFLELLEFSKERINALTKGN